MTRDRFLEILNKKREMDNYCDDLQNLLHCDIFEAPSFENGYMFFDYIWEEAFTEQGADLIYGYLYDNLDSNELNVTIDNKDYCITNDRDLWDLVKNYLKH